MQKNIKILIRHTKSYKRDRIDAFKEYQKDVVNKKFPSKNNVVFAEKKELEKFKKLIKKI